MPGRCRHRVELENTMLPCRLVEYYKATAFALSSNPCLAAFSGAHINPHDLAQAVNGSACPEREPCRISPSPSCSAVASTRQTVTHPLHLQVIAPTMPKAHPRHLLHQLTQAQRPRGTTSSTSSENFHTGKLQCPKVAHLSCCGAKEPGCCPSSPKPIVWGLRTSRRALLTGPGSLCS